MAGKLADGLSWWLAGWKPGSRPLVGTAVTLALSLALTALWLWLGFAPAGKQLLGALGDMLVRLGLEPDWRPVLYGLCLIGAVIQAAIGAADLFTPNAIPLRAGARAAAELVSAAFSAGVILGFDLEPLRVLDPGFRLSAWIGLAFALVAAQQAIRGLANLRQALRPAAPAVA